MDIREYYACKNEIKNYTEHSFYLNQYRDNAFYVRSAN